MRRDPALSHANENPLHGMQMFPTNISLLTKGKAEKPVHGQHPLRGDRVSSTGCLICSLSLNCGNFH